MAPVSATAKGVARQQIENPELTNLIERLSSFDTLKDDIQDIFDPRIEVTNHSKIDVKGLVAELEKLHRWKFEEMVSVVDNIFVFHLFLFSLSHLLIVFIFFQ